ncbi:MAG: O-antigen ligase family protein [Xenococcaceae cyanobacterium]
MNQELNKIIRAIEPSLTIFILVFQSGLLYFQSFFADPDNPLASGTTPLDGLLSLIQILIYLIILVLLVFRWQTCLSLALKNPFIWLLATLTVVSCLWSEWPEVSLRKGIVTLQTTYFGLYFASRYTLKEQLKLLVWAMAIVVIVSTLFSAAFPGVAIEVGGNAGALRGPFAQKNPFARLMVLAAIAFFVEALSNRRLKFLLWGLIGLSALLIVLANSKTALVLSIVLFLLVPLYRGLRQRTTLVIPLSIATIIIAGSLAVMLMGNWENIAQFLGKDASLSGRTDLWEISLEKVFERPWFGYGYQSFWMENGEASYVWQAIAKLQGDYKPPHAHNGFINISLDLGSVGLGLFLLIIAITYGRSLVYLRSGKTTLEIWPIIYTTFFFMYNHSEDTIIAPSSIFWSLLVAAAFTTLKPKEIQQKRSSEKIPQEVFTQSV